MACSEHSRISPRLASADRELVRRLELGHADSGVSYARAFAEHHPDTGVAVEELAGGWAVFQSIDSPVTQALAIGMNGTVTREELSRLLSFYHLRGSPAVIDLASVADSSIWGLLVDKLLIIREISDVLARRVRPEEELFSDPTIEVESVPRDAIRDWARLILHGFTENSNITDDQVGVVAAVPSHMYPCMAKRAAQKSAAAGMTVLNGLATLTGDATIPSARRSGLQLALIHHRLRQAATMGCDLASASVLPGSTSHRNYERAGFQLIYSRIQVAIPH